MRVTGAADPTVPLKDTLKGKLPQYKIVNEAGMDTVLTETRSVLQQDMLMKYIIQTMLQNVWRSVPLWVQHLERT